MMRLRDIPVYQSRYLRVEDLKGRSVAVEIRAVTLEEYFNKRTRAKEKMAVLWFAGKQKGLCINRTRLAQLEEIFGTDDADCYSCRRVLLHPTKQHGKETIFIGGVPED